MELNVEEAIEKTIEFLNQTYYSLVRPEFSKYSGIYSFSTENLSYLEKIDIEGVRVNVIRSGIGTITESDVVLANASNAIIIGFNVMPSAITKEVAKEYGVDIRLYTIIYKAIEEMELAMKGLLDPEYEEKALGSAEIRKIFTFSKIGKIAGVFVTDGVMKNGANEICNNNISRCIK